MSCSNKNPCRRCETMFGLHLGKKKSKTTTENYRRIATKHHKQACVVCGAYSPLEVHHKDRNRNNNHPKNLEWRCRKHHLEIHGKGMRQSKIVIAPKKERSKKWLFLRTKTDYRQRVDGGTRGTQSQWLTEEQRMSITVKAPRRKKRWFILRKGTGKKTIRI